MSATITRKSTKPPLLKINFLSHGTLESRDLQASRRFYEEVLGLEVIQHAPIAMTIRHGSNHTYVVVLTNRPQEMHVLNHNGLDVGSEEEVRAAYELLRSVEQAYGLRKISKPARLHGYYAFMFQDMDGNWWEIMANQPGGYSGLFDNPENDLANRADAEAGMADFTPYQDVVLLRDIPEEGLCAGDVGTIVERHDVPGRETGYSVEFFDMLGNTVAVVTLPDSALRVPSRADRPAVRSQPESVNTP